MRVGLLPGGLVPVPSDITILTITSGATVLTPTFTVRWPDFIAVDDVVTLQQSASSSFTSPTTYTHTITNADVVAGSLGFGNSSLLNGTYYFRTKATRASVDITGWSNTDTITIADPPATITSGSTASVPEDENLVHVLTASKAVTWSVSGGADAAQFEIYASSILRWSSNGTRDFEAPADADTNNAYIVQISATTAGGVVTNQTITVTVTDTATAPVSIFTTAGLSLNDTGFAGGSLRNSITVSAGSSGRVRVTFKAGSNAGLVIANASIGVRASGTTVTTAAPVELTFSGLSGFSIAAGATAISDFKTLAFTVSDKLVVILDVTSGSVANTHGGDAGATLMFKGTGTSYNSSSESGFSGPTATWNYGVSKIETSA